MVYAAREWRVASTLSGTQSGGAAAHLMKLFWSKIKEENRQAFAAFGVDFYRVVE